MEPKIPPSGPLMGNRYKIITTQSSGRLATNYGAFDLFTGKAANITAINKQRTKHSASAYPLNKLRTDAAFCLKVVHPDILHAYDLFDDDDYFYVVSELSGIPPISEMGAGSFRPDAMAFISAMQKVIYAVEYYHSNQSPGCCIRPQHVRLSPSGDVQIDHFLDCRLSFLSEAKEGNVQLVLTKPDDAIFMDIIAAGEVVALLLRQIPQIPVAMTNEDKIVHEALPALRIIGERMRKGEYADIKQVSKAMHEVENKMCGELDRIAHAFPKKSHRRHLAAGEVLFREGDSPNGETFIVERGVIQISKKASNGRDIHLDVSKTGDIVGEMALIDRQPRMATARALEPSTLVIITSAEFRATMEKMDGVGRRLIQVLAGRLRFQAQEVARLKALIGVGR